MRWDGGSSQFIVLLRAVDSVLSWKLKTLSVATSSSSEISKTHQTKLNWKGGQTTTTKMFDFLNQSGSWVRTKLEMFSRSISINKDIWCFSGTWLMVKHGTIDIVQTSKHKTFQPSDVCWEGLRRLPYLSIKQKLRKKCQAKRLHVEWFVKRSSTKSLSAVTFLSCSAARHPRTTTYTHEAMYRNGRNGKESSLMMT